MIPVTLKNRPATPAPRTRLYDFQEDDVLVRVSLRLQEAQESGNLTIDAQAFQVDAEGQYMAAPDGRPSRSPGSKHVLHTSSLGDTHSLHPGWVRIVGDYDAATFEKTATRSAGRPVEEPDFETNPTGQHFNESTGVGYRWSQGEAYAIALGKAEELLRIVKNSAPLSGLDF